MDKEQIQEFTRRVTQSNKSGLTLVNYEIVFAYLDDARTAHENEDWDAFKNSLRRAQNGIAELMGTLDFSYDLSKNLYRIYVFCKDSLAAAMYKRSEKEIEDARRLLKKLYEAFREAAKSDGSEPLMKNTQQVYAGYTYGKNDLVENYSETDTTRGFLV